MLEPRQAVESGTLDLPIFDDDYDDTTAPVETGPKTPWWRTRKAMGIGGAVLAVILVAGGIAAAASRRPQVTYTTAAVTMGNLTITVSATGPVQSALYTVNAISGATITEIDVKVGDHVKAGQVLAKLDSTSLQDAVTQAQDQVNSAQTALNNAYTNLNNTRNTAAASENSAYQTEQATLNKAGGCDTTCQNQAYAQYNQAIAQAQAQIASAQGQVSSAQAQLNSAQASLQTAQHNLASGTLTAPHDGTVAVVNGVVGGTVGNSTAGSSGSSGSGSGGSSGGSAFIEIADLTALQVAADVNEADIGSVAVGQPVTFTVSAYSSRQFRGTVASISPIGTSSSGVVTYPVTINVDMTRLQGASLFPGMTANVTIATAQRAGVELVPATAVTFARSAATSGLITTAQLRGAIQQGTQDLAQYRQSNPDTAAKDNPTIGVVLEQANGKWTIKPVILGLTNGTVYEVLSGLNDGEVVVTGQQGGSTSTSTSGTGTGTGTRGGFGGGFGGGGFGGRGGAGG